MQSNGPVNHVGRGPLGSDHSDQWNEERRGPPMGSQAARAVRKPRHDLCDRDHRGVASEDRRWRSSRLYGFEQLAFELEVLRSRLDNEICTGDGLFELCAGTETIEGRRIFTEILQI